MDNRGEISSATARFDFPNNFDCGTCIDVNNAAKSLLLLSS